MTFEMRDNLSWIIFFIFITVVYERAGGTAGRNKPSISITMLQEVENGLNGFKKRWYGCAFVQLGGGTAVSPDLRALHSRRVASPSVQ